MCEKTAYIRPGNDDDNRDDDDDHDDDDDKGDFEMQQCQCHPQLWHTGRQACTRNQALPQSARERSLAAAGGKPPEEAGSKGNTHAATRLATGADTLHKVELHSLNPPHIRDQVFARATANAIDVFFLIPHGWPEVGQRTILVSERQHDEVGVVAWKLTVLNPRPRKPRAAFTYELAVVVVDQLQKFPAEIRPCRRPHPQLISRA